MDLDGLEEYYSADGAFIGKSGTSTELRIITKKEVISKAKENLSHSNYKHDWLLEYSKPLTIKDSSKDFKELWANSQDGNERTGYIVLDAKKAELSFVTLNVKSTSVAAPDPYAAGEKFESMYQTTIANVHTHPEEAKYIGKVTDQDIFNTQYSVPGGDGNTAKERGARYTIGVYNIDYHSPKGKASSTNNLTSRNKLEKGKFNLLKHALEQYGRKK